MDYTSLVLSRFLGLRNLGTEATVGQALEDGSIHLAEAVNVDVDDDAKMRRRRAVTQITADPAHSLWSDGSRAYCVLAGDLVAVEPSGATRVMYPGVGAQLNFEAVANKVFCRGRGAALVIDGDSVRAWGVPVVGSLGIPELIPGSLMPAEYHYAVTYTRTSDSYEGGYSKVQRVSLTEPGGIRITGLPAMFGHTLNVYLSTPGGEQLYLAEEGITSATVDLIDQPDELTIPARTFEHHPPFGEGPMCYSRGRILLADGAHVYLTEPFNYEAVIPRHYMPFESAVTFLAPVTDGVYVGTDDKIWYISGSYPDVSRVQATGYGAPTQVPSSIPPDLLTSAGIQSREARMVMTHKGVVALLDGGVAINLTHKAFEFPRAQSAAVMVRSQDGINQFVGVLSHTGTPTASSARFGDYVDAEIIRFKGA